MAIDSRHRWMSQRMSPGSAMPIPLFGTRWRQCCRRSYVSTVCCRKKETPVWRIDEAPCYDLPDVARFIETLNSHGDFFERGAPITVARAPGRLDLMGGIADYSGALVLELPLAAATLVAAQPTRDGRLTVRSLASLGTFADTEATVSVEALAPHGVPLDYPAACMLLAAQPRQRWAAYVVGAFVVLARERGLFID